MLSARLWIRVSQGWLRADQVVEVRYGSSISGDPYARGKTFAVTVLLPVPEGSGEDGFGLSESTFARVTTEDAARKVAEELLHLLLGSPEDAAGVVEVRGEAVALSPPGSTFGSAD
ncbi:hypothetical protein AB0E55_22895 [Amycolatopsis keratiniphila]|uniref:hypothetical protein n=1 Tax=Amycolatopsis keratiniphila TaxID=129921 RepID=UPI0033E3D12B